MPISLPAHLQVKSLLVTQQLITTDGFKSFGNNGTPSINADVTENGDAYHHRTVIKLTHHAGFPVVANTTASHGLLIYTLPPHSAINNSHMHITLTGDGNNGVPMEMGVGIEEASGNGTGTLTVNQDNILPDANTSVGSTFMNITSNAGAAYHNAQPIYLNISGVWAATETLTPHGSVILDWTALVDT